MAHRNPSAHDFGLISSVNIKRSSFDRSHSHKTTFNAGYLIPIFVDEVLPGDTFKLSATIFCRMSTPIVPLMDNLYIDTHYFFVPNRLLWDNFERFMGAQKNPGDSTDFLIPYVASTAGQTGNGFQPLSIFDYMGLPVSTQASTTGTLLQPSALWSRAYNLIYNEWYRDENLQDSVVVDTGDGPDSETDYPLLRRGKRHDYFTSCLPFPQKGPSVALPGITGGKVPVQGISVLGRSFALQQSDSTYYDTLGKLVPSGQNIFSTTDTLHTPSMLAVNGSGSGSAAVSPSNHPDIFVDIKSATSTINALRQAVALQTLYERDARGGTRYTEIVTSHFGVRSPDARLQRPEYLGGGTSPVNFTSVPQTSQTVSDSPQGHLAAFSTALSTSGGFVHSFVEHGVLLGIASVRADQTYQHGIPRMFSRKTRVDLYLPDLAHLGEQAVLNQEIFYTGDASKDEAVFGYQERWSEYRYGRSRITGLFRSKLSGSKDPSYDFWHLANKYDSTPALNAQFIVENPPMDRVLARPTLPHFECDIFFKLNCVRPMPVYSTPGFAPRL